MLVFDRNTFKYDTWFKNHPVIYQSELLALKQAVPKNKKSLDIEQPVKGDGKGSFAVIKATKY